MKESSQTLPKYRNFQILTLSTEILDSRPTLSVRDFRPDFPQVAGIFGTESGKVRAWNLPTVSTVSKFYLPYPIPTSILVLCSKSYPTSTLSFLLPFPTLFFYLHLLELDPLDGER